MLAVLFLPFALNAQTLTVCDGTASNEYVPFYGWYADEDQHNQMIYPASLLTDMTGQAIQQMTFYIDPNGNNGSYTEASRLGTWTVSLGETTDTTLSDLDNTTTLTQVYQGYFDCSTGTLTLTFDIPYSYNGGNLLVDLDHTAASYNHWFFLGIAAPDAAYTYDLSHDFLPKVTFEYGAVTLCNKPTNLTISNLTNNSATLSWTGCADATSYVVQYMPNSSTDWDNATELTTSNTSIPLDNLTPATTYKVRVKVLCSDNTETAWSAVITFTPGIYVMASSGSDTLVTCGVMIYDNGGPNSSYSNSCNSTLVLYPANDGEMMMLSGTASTESGWDYIYIYDGAGTDNQVAQISGSNQTISVISTVGPLTLKFTSDGSSTYSGFELLAQCVSCFPPSNLTVSDQTLDGATISWSGEADEYAIYLSGAMTGYYTTYGNSFTFSGLTSSSNYTVQIRSLCSGDSSILSSAIFFSTACDPITVTEAEPWTEGFEEYPGSGAQPFVCWATPITYQADNGLAPFVYCGYGQACHGGENSAEMKGDTNLLVFPEFTNDIHDLRLSFWATGYNPSYSTSYEQLTHGVIGVITDINDPSSFEPLGNAGIPGPRGSSNAGNGNFMGPFDFNGVQATSGRIAILYTGPGSTYGWNIDDIIVSLAPNCPSPVKTSVQAVNIGGHVATITFVDTDPTHNSWTVFYREADADDSDPWLSVTTADTFANISGLDPETQYEAYVITNCSTPAVEPDATLSITFTTTVACPAPTALTLTAVSTDEATVSWTCAGNAFNVEYGPAGFTPGTGTTNVASTTSFTMPNLTPNTAYTIYVTTDCSADNDGVSDTVSFNFNTAQVPADLPYTSDFTDPTDDWLFNNGNCANFWMKGTVNNVDALFVTSDSVTAGYSNNYTVASVEKLFTVGDNASFNVSFDVNAGGESTYDYLKVFFAPATASFPANSTSSVPTYAQYDYDTYAMNFSEYLALTAYSNAQYPYKFNLTSGNTVHVAAEMQNPNTNPDATSTAKLVFLWKNDGSVSTQPLSAIISNITVSVNNCPAPTNVSDSAITTTSADIFWTPGDQETQWAVEYGPHGFTPGTGEMESVYSDPFITLSNLTAATSYDIYVCGICGSGDSSMWVGPHSIFTACDVITQLPFTENFDSYSTNTRPECWSFPITYSDAPYVTSGNNSSTPNSLFFQSQTTSPTTAVTPPFDADINTLRVKFMLKAESTTSSGTFEVGVMSDPNNVSTFESVQIIQPANTAWNQYTVKFDSTTMTGSNRYIAFRQHSNSSYYYYWLDDVTVMEIPTCEEPTDLISMGTTTTSVTLGWTSHGEESDWNIEYGPAGFTLGTGTLVSANSNPFEVDNLTPATPYDFYVQAVCGSGDESIWVGPYMATPGSMNMPTSGTHSITACDMVIYDDGGATGDYSTSCNATLTINPETPSSLISISGTVNTENNWDYLYVYDGADESAPLLATYSGSATITDLTSTVGPLTIKFTSDASVVYPGFALTVACVSNTCPKPTNLTVSNITTSSADIAWVSNGTESTWNFEYKEATESDWNTVAVTGTPSYQLTNLTTATQYDIRVQADCSADDQSLWLNGSFTTDCDAISTLPYVENFDSYTGTTYTDNNGIAPTCWTTFSNNTTYGAPHIIGSGSYHYASSGNSLVFTCSSAGNDAYAALPTFTADLNTLSLTFWRAMESTSSGTLSVGYVTSISDLAGTFVEVATIPSVSSSNADTFTVNFNEASIPTNGNICFHWNVSSSYYTCCVDDITVNLAGDAPVITNPTVATNAASALGQNNATLNATITNPDNVAITAKGFEWKLTNGGTYAPINGTGTGNTFTANLTGLTPSTSYTFKAFITYNGTTVYGSETTFTTLPQGVDPCDVPTGLHATDIENHAVTIAWDDNANVDNWNIQYRVAGSGALSSATSSTNTYTITNLNGDTDYEIQVQADCGNGNFSDWSAFITVHTSNVGIENWLENSITLFPNPARDYVDLRVDGNVNVTAMEVYDVYGKLINTVGTAAAMQQPYRINVNGLANGMYFVRVSTDNGVVTKSFVKK